MEEKLNRREVFAVLPALVVMGTSGLVEGQVHASEYPAPQSAPAAGQNLQASDKTGRAVSLQGTGMLAEARVFPLDTQPVRKMANGGESRDIAHGTLATGETVSLHQSVQMAGASPNLPHVIKHSEFIMVREGELEFEHELNGEMVTERVGPGGVIYVAYGTRHALRNIGDGPVMYFVAAIGGDVK